MVLKLVHDKDTNVKFHVLVNSKAIKVHDQLLVYKPRKEVVPLSSAESSKRVKR